MNWDSLFSNQDLKTGMHYFSTGKIEMPDFDGEMLTGVVMGKRSCYVELTLDEHYIPVVRKCTCPQGKKNGTCAHMAAMMFLAQSVLITDDADDWDEEEDVPPSRINSDVFSSLDALQEEDRAARMETGTADVVPLYLSDSYNYYHPEDLLKSVAVKPPVLKEAQRLKDSGGLEDFLFDEGYMQGAPDGMLNGFTSAYTKKEQTRVQMRFTAHKVEASDCNSYKCTFRYEYGIPLMHHLCVHEAALLLQTIDYLKENAGGDATDLRGVRFMNAMLKDVAVSPTVRGEQDARREAIQIRPSVSAKGRRMVASFSVGSTKQYKIKDLREFDEKMRTRGSMQFGKSTILQLDEDVMADEASRNWYHFIRNAIAEEDTRADYISEMSSVSYRSRGAQPETIRIKSEIGLFGAQIDDFFTCAEGQSIPFQKGYGSDKEKKVLTTGETQPDVRIKISAAYDEDHVFEGVLLEADIPEFIHGQTADYYIDGNVLNRVSKAFSGGIAPLMQGMSDPHVRMRIGRENLSRFYYDVLPKLKQITTVTEPDASEIAPYIPPEATFIFYLDYSDGSVICRPQAVYGNDSHFVIEHAEKDGHFSSGGRYRDNAREYAVAHDLIQYFPYLDFENRIIYTDDTEDAVFYAATAGVDYMLSLGEVHGTRRFQEIGQQKAPKFQVGVSLSGHLLELSLGETGFSEKELLGMFRAYREKKQYYRLESGAFLALDRGGEDNSIEALALMMETLGISVQEFVKGKTKIPAYRALYLEKMLEETETVYAERDRHFKRLIKEFKTVEDAEDDPPEGVREILRRYQKTGFRWLKTLDRNGFGGILADDMGLGKTLQVISVILSEKETAAAEGKRQILPSLVVCPASLVYNWGAELQRFAPSLSVCLITGTAAEREKLLADADQYDVLVTSYDLLKRDIAQYEDIRFRFQIADEAQFIKNHTTAAAKSVKLIRADTKYALTGTPIENRLSELWSIMDYLMPGLLFSYDAFRKNYETPIVKNEDKETSVQLNRMVSSFILRRLKKDVLKDLPDKLEEIRYCALEGEQKALYNAQVLKMRDDIEGQDDETFRKSKIEILAELTRIRRICCDPSLCFENYYAESAKRESCMDLIRESMDGGHKALLFSQFTSMLSLIEKDLKDAGIPYYLITGQTPKEKRTEYVNAFNADDTPVFLISLKAGGTGLNLTGADIVIHYDPWWNVAAQNQATDRAHRIGQRKVVTVYKLIAKNTIEEKILALQDAKQQLADEILSGESLSSEVIDKEALLSLLSA